MQKIKQRLALTAAALAFTPITIIQLIQSGSENALVFSALAAFLAGIVAAFAAIEYIGTKKW